MGAENFPHVADFAPDCYIIKQLHILQQKITEVKNNQKDNQTANRRWLKQKLLDEAAKISKVILEIHDEKGICKCSKPQSEQDFVKSSEETNLQLMLDYLYKLNGFLWQLDTESMIEKPVSSKKPLNPLSKCFVPKYLCITENPEFQSDNLPDIVKDVDAASKKIKSDGHPNSFKILQCRESNSICRIANETAVSSNKPNDDHMLSEFLYNNLSFIEDIKNIEICDLTVKNKSSTITQDIYNQKADYDKLLKYQNQIKALWNESDENTKSSNLKCTSELEKFTLDKFVNSWSVNLDDKKLLNPGILLEPCGCPPCFGYNIPPIFWGNPFNLKPLCSEKNIHLSCYESKSKQLQTIPPKVEITQVPELNAHNSGKRFPETERFREFRLNKHKKDFQRFVSDVVYDITKVLNESDLNENSILDRKTKSNQNLHETSIPQGSLSYLGTIDKHDILNGFSRCARLGQRYLKTPRLIRQICSTPCSVWCDFNKEKTWGWNKSLSNLHKKSHIKNENSDSVNDTINLQSRNTNASEKIHNVFGNIEANFHQKLIKDDGDSGYDSATMSSASSSSKIRKVGSLDLESEFWTPLPDCVKENNENENIRSGKSGNQQFMKNQNSLAKSFKTRNEHEEQKSKSIDIKRKLTKVRNPQLMSRRYDLQVALHQ